jgi:hypothetical protein
LTLQLSPGNNGVEPPAFAEADVAAFAAGIATLTVSALVSPATVINRFSENFIYASFPRDDAGRCSTDATVTPANMPTGTSATDQQDQASRPVRHGTLTFGGVVPWPPGADGSVDSFRSPRGGSFHQAARSG